ncbi:BTAD domain-containing putative transcriptional regulator [Nocardia goodfellowii]|uniref:DNA-binding SARP family transcriptional activator n=1 Tax=Nocardia goodfellowii TaxID=882446 RepID=A0ABS4QMW8_9NOCA|nr:BTAD domain-containing putative transcriptional regulator [Nocardia goodfellowii]MBP2193050.1 DNA-binding SARP family transcriptional activator [Nocardia goodfellowii]
MTEPQVQVFGPLQVSLGGRTAHIGAGRQRAVLGRLVLAGGQAIGTDRLVEDIWEGDPPSQAPGVLQVQIHNLRRVLEPSRRPRTAARILVSEGGGYALRLAATNVDAWRFEAQMRQYEQRMHDPADRPGPLERYRLLDEALNCWHGAAFESFSSASWATAEVSRLTDLRVSATEMRAEAALELGRLGEVVTVLRQQVEEHPGREESVRLLAAAQYRLGQQVEALATVRRAREFLRSEFGIDPGPRLADLESAILKQNVEPDHVGDYTTMPLVVSAHRDRPRPRALAGSSSEPGAEPTFYPRQRSALYATAAEAKRSGLRLTWLAGAAGMGKTTLTTFVAANLRADGWSTAIGRCPEVDGAPPAWGWSEILAALGGAPPHPEPGTGHVDPFTIVRAVTERCRELVGNGPVAIILEDAHRADDATLQVLRQLANWLQHEPILIIVTVRDHELSPALRAAEAALADRMTERLELAGLDLAGTRKVAEDAGLTTIDLAALQTLHERTGGNPFFIRELSKRIAARGDSHGLPENIRAVLIDRIGQTPEGMLTVLQYIAVWGREIEFDTLLGFSGVAEETLVDLIDSAVAARLAGFDHRERIVLDQAMVQDTVYNSISPLRRTRMHWSAMEFLENRGEHHSADLEYAELLAHHAARGATRTTAAQALRHVITVARRYEQLGVHQGAVDLWRGAVELHELAGHSAQAADPGDRLALFETLRGLADALTQDGRALHARVVRKRALGLAEELDDKLLMVRALTCRITPTIWVAQDWGTTDAHLLEALEAALARTDSVMERTSLLVTLAIETAEAIPPMREHAQEALRLARQTGDAELICAALNAVANTIDEPAAASNLRTIAEELVDVARGAGLRDYQALAHYLQFLAACRDTDLLAAKRHSADVQGWARYGHPSPLPDVLLAFDAVIEVLRGDLAAAEREYQRFVARMAEAGVADVELIRLVGALTVSWARGDISGLLDRVQPLYAAEPDRVAQLYIVTLLHGGDEAQARKLFHAHSVVRRDVHRPLMCAFRATAAVALGEVEAARDMFEALLPYSGTLIGFDTGAAYFGPVDAVLADLAELTGKADAATAFRARSAAVLRRVHAALDALAPRALPSRAHDEPQLATR